MEYRKLIGHSGPVFSTSFNNDNSFLLSSSADRTGNFYLSLLSLYPSLLVVFQVVWIMFSISCRWAGAGYTSSMHQALGSLLLLSTYLLTVRATVHNSFQSFPINFPIAFVPSFLLPQLTHPRWFLSVPRVDYRLVRKCHKMGPPVFDSSWVRF